MSNSFFNRPVYIIMALVGMSVGYDLNKHKICYYLGNTHLDTHWNWPVETTINQYLPNTLRENFKLFNKYPDYKFSFEGAYRYMLIKKHHPVLYDSLRQYISQNRWCVAGSMVEACDVNIPSPEALIRQILYGNGFFEEEFGKKSLDIFLPDCFGFGLALPTVAVHCGLKGFYTQKLSWGVWKNPTNQVGGMGLWEGVDGSTLISPWSCTDTSYLVKQLGDATGVYASYNFTYIGDIGGAPSDASVAARQARINLNDTTSGPNSSFKIIYASSDQFFRDLTPAMVSRFPKYKGELLLTSHGTGCYTSRPEMKVLNRKNELAANAAEASSVAANWLANKIYPTTDLKESWIRFLWHQFHDDLTGTSIPEVYAYSKPELDSTLSQFNSVIAKSLEAVSLSLDTKVEGIPLVVYNPLAFDREDIVDTIISFESGAPSYLRVFDKIGLETPSQEISRNGSKIRLAFLAKVPSMGYAVYDIRSSDAPCAIDSGLSVTSSSLSSKRYEVTIDANGDISTVYDKINQKHLLSAPARLALLPNNPSQWPQWEIPWSDISATPRTYLSGPAMLQVVESGPVRITLQVTRHVDSSTIVQLISLNAGGAGDVVEIKMNLNWKASNTLLKAEFPLTAISDSATYDLGLGTVKRGINFSKLYEVPAQQWADQTDFSGRYGVTVMNDSRYGWDKPDYERLRLTIMHSPQNFDRGNYSLRYGIFGHAQDWRNGSIAASARFNQPLIAHVTEKHTGTAGRELSMVTASSGIAVMALKKAEKSDKYVIRVRELEGKICNNAELVFSAPVTFAEELDGYEDVKGAVSVSGSRIRFNINAYSPKTFSFRLGNNKPQIPLRSDIFSFWVSPFDTLVTDAPVMQLRNTGSNPPTSIRPSSGAAWLTLSVSGIGWNQSISHNVISSKMEKSICTTIVQVQSDNFSDGYYTVIAKKGSSVPVSLRFVPDWAVVLPNKQTKLNVEAYDKNGDVIDWPIVWSCDTKGSVDTNGEYYSGSDTGWSIVSAAAQGIVNITAQSQIRIDSLMPGLKYDFYKNYSAKTVDSIEYKSVDSTKTTYGFFFNYGNLDSFAIKYTGVIFIEKAGDYTFYVKADNGAVLYIDGNKIVDRDGVGNFWTEKSGLANLTRGLHTIKVLYLKNTYYYAGELSVAWSSVPLSIPKQTIPGNLFYHRKYSGEHVSIENLKIKHLVPACYALFPVVPNPMKLTSQIMFDVPSVNNDEHKSNIAIRLYDIRGRLVRTIINGKVQSGHHVVNFNGLSDEGRKLVSGIYFVKMNTPTKTMNKKIVIAR